MIIIIYIDWLWIIILLNVYLEILKMYMLYYPDIVKFIYGNLYFNSKNLLYNDNLKEYIIDDSVLSFGEDIKSIILEVCKFRKDANISNEKSIDSVSLNIKKDYIKLLPKSLDDILRLINSKNVNIDFSDETYVELIMNDKIIIKKR